MAVAGTIVVELSANTAQFEQQMGRAGGAIRTVGQESSRSERALVSFAARGIGTVVPEAEGAAHALLGLVEKATRAAGALALLAKTGLLVGVGIGAFLVGQRLREEIDNWLALGETVKQTMDRLKQEADEQEKFATQRVRAIQILVGFEDQLAQARLKANASIAKGQGQDDVAASFDQAAEVFAAQAEKRQRDRTAFEITDAARRNAALLASEAILANKRIDIAERYYANLQKLRDDATAKSVKQFTDETNAMMESLTRRLQLRKSMEDEATAAATRQGFGDVFAPFEQADQTRKDAEKIAQGFALLLDKGKAFRDVFPEILRLDEEFQQRGFSGFAAAVENARSTIRGLGIDAQSIEQSFDALNQKLANAPFGAAAAAIDPLIAKLRELEAQNFRTAQSVQILANTITTSRQGPPQPVVTAPLDLGFQP